jgi:hypothetical protein
VGGIWRPPTFFYHRFGPWLLTLRSAGDTATVDLHRRQHVRRLPLLLLRISQAQESCPALAFVGEMSGACICRAVADVNC